MRTDKRTLAIAIIVVSVCCLITSIILIWHFSRPNADTTLSGENESTNLPRSQQQQVERMDEEKAKEKDEEKAKAKEKEEEKTKEQEKEKERKEQERKDLEERDKKDSPADLEQEDQSENTSDFKENAESLKNSLSAMKDSTVSAVTKGAKQALNTAKNLKSLISEKAKKIKKHLEEKQ